MLNADWDAIAEEAVDLLRRYIRIDTSNPPGNECLAADFLEAVLSKEGIPSRRYDSAPGRTNLVADLAAESDEKPLILLHHSDVVPVEADQWSVPPFEGLLRDGFVWGRGALDMKGMGVLELMTVLALKRSGTKLKRPIRFLTVADEEAGSAFGAEWLDKEHPEILDGAFVLNEGGYGATSYLGVERPLFGVSMAEKSPLWLTLRATGRPGHGSAPHDDNVLDRMVRALQRVHAWQRPYVMTEPVKDALRVAHAEGYVDLNPDKAGADAIAHRHRSLRTILANTISATGLHAGMKHNVIPATAQATSTSASLPKCDASSMTKRYTSRRRSPPRARQRPATRSCTLPLQASAATSCPKQLSCHESRQASRTHAPSAAAACPPTASCPCCWRRTSRPACTATTSVSPSPTSAWGARCSSASSNASVSPDRPSLSLTPLPDGLESG